MTKVVNSLRALARRTIATVTAAAVLTGQLGLATPSSATAITRAEYEACQARDEHGFRAAIDKLTLKGLETGVVGIDFRAVVAEEWRKTRVDDVLDRQVDKAIEEVRDESSWSKLVASLASKDKAQELAVAVTERVYKSEQLKIALENLATGVGKSVAKRIELATLDTAEPAMQCMQAFLGQRFGSTVARAVAQDAGKEYTVDPARAGANISTGQVLVEGGEGIAGAVVLMVRRQLSNMAARVGQRLVGSVLSRLVSVVAGGVGLVLIAKDIWDFRHGVLPIIASEMKAPSTKDKVREELAKGIGEQIGENLKDISGRTADRVVEIWQDFRRAHAVVLNLSEREPRFREYLDLVKPEQLARLDEVVSLVVAGEGEPAVMKRLENGTLNRAVTQLQPAALDIARETRSIETAFQWTAVAGSQIGKVVEHEIHRRTKPDAFTSASLQRLFSVDDRLAVMRLAALKPDMRERLFELDGAELKSLARALSESELDSLARYLTGLEKSAGQRLLRAVAQTPSQMHVLGNPTVRDAILASRDQGAAVAMMLKAYTAPDPTVFVEHATLAWNGRISPILLWEKHSVAVGATLFAGFVFFLWFWRLLFGRRPKVIIQQAPKGKAA